MHLLIPIVHFIEHLFITWCLSFGPWVREEPRNVKARFRILIEQLAKVLEVGRYFEIRIIRSESIPKSGPLLFCDHLVKRIRLRVGIFKRWALCLHHESNNSCGERIMLRSSGWFALNYLWWLVTACASRIIRHITVLRSELLGETEINDFQIELGVKQQVLHLKIAVRDSVIMAEFNAIE